MEPTALSLDADRLRTAARDVLDLAEALRPFSDVDLGAALPGSALARTVPPDPRALAADTVRWAQRTEAAADRMTDADAAAAVRLRP
ncbi:hypothetical protein MCHIJ_40150 [Mycolicibacterium chitae]|uniref:Uncharacterized protein n=1 Tax=Mycolicibacterium chitae TaxID=1792 RepID=A0A3S4VBR8_MYCCI|nr:hypothetical protein [Mycolicibacterium chitae]BBZ04578.1 hypothetical protein MCHIJ_40150 [Mycolicibacterium chitae]VEG48209.1 Uncharacterised protein [Mycolicibacterium chitae]